MGAADKGDYRNPGPPGGLGGGPRREGPPAPETQDGRRSPLGSAEGFLCVGGVILAGAVIRILYALHPHVCFGDEACYVWLAKAISSGAPYSYYDGVQELHFPPLFPIALSGIHLLVPDWEAVTRVAYVIFGSLIPLPVYLLGRDMYSARAGLLASLLFAAMPTFTSGVLFAESLSEPLYLLCLTSGIYFVYHACVTGRWIFHGLAGGCVSLAYLTRPEGLVYLAVGCLFFALAWLLDRAFSVWKAAARIAVFAAAFLVVACPYLLYLRQHVGKWALTTKDTTTYKTTRGLVTHDGEAFQRDTWGLNAKGEVNYFAHEFDESLLGLLCGPYRHRVMADVRANLATVQDLILKPWVFGGVLLIFSILGLLGSPWSRDRFRAEILNVSLFLPLAGVLVLFVNPRNLYSFTVPLTLWAGLGLLHVAGVIRTTYLPGFLGSGGVRFALQVILFSAVVAYLVRRGQTYFESQRSARDEVWIASSWLKRNTPEDAVVMGAGPEVAFHAQRRWLPLPYAELSQVVEFGRKRGATHLCIRKAYLRVRAAQKRELFDGARNFDDLELLLPVTPDSLFVAYRLKAKEKR